MDTAAARDILGVGPGASAAELRAAYRARLRLAHPDLQGRDGGTATVVAAYRVLRDAEPADPVAPVAPVPATAAVVVDGDTVTAELPAGDLLALLVDAGDTIGEVAYVDRLSGLVEVVVDIPDHGACSVVWTLEGRATGITGQEVGSTTAWCTVEPLGGGPAPPAAVVAALLADGLRAVAGR